MVRCLIPGSIALMLCPLLMLSYSKPSIAALTFQPCEIGDQNSQLTVRAECSELTVPENREDPTSGSITLFIAKLPARSTDSREDPLTILAGGPGQSASESFPPIQSAFEPIRKNRDIYLIDQRGTGKSNKLVCPETDDDSDPLTFDAEKISTTMLNCRKELKGDPRYYTTSVAVRDLEDIRLKLGIDKWNIYGISYGTRVALHYLRKFPAAARTMILDAVVPPTVSLGTTISTGAQRAFEKMLLRCEASEECNAKFPDLAEKSFSLMESLREQPRQITYENFASGRLETIEFKLEHLTTTLRMLSYSSHGISILPVLLHDAYANDNFAPIARQAQLQASSLGSTLASGMHNAVVCTEDEPFIRLDSVNRAAMATTFLGLIPVEALQASCKHWPPGVMDADFKEPVVSDLPVLILSGDADPVTPPEFGDIIADTLPNALHIVNPGQGHMQAWLGCTPGIMLNFLERGNTQDIDFGCLERQNPLPFFVDANGPTP